MFMMSTAGEELINLSRQQDKNEQAYPIHGNRAHLERSGCSASDDALVGRAEATEFS